MTLLKQGEVAPDFTAVDQDGNTVSLSDFKSKKCFIFFYPKANTSG
jgi:peroxiredoxin Q/BCP